MTPTELFNKNVHKFVDAPASYEGQYDKYVRRMGKQVPVGTPWAEFMKQIDREDKELAAANDLTAPLWLPDDKHGWTGVDCPEGSREALRRACAVGWGDGPGVLAVFKALAEFSPLWMPMPANVSDRNDIDVFVFARMRVFFSGAGFENWKVLATELCKQWNSCPFDPDQTQATWMADLRDAHKTCGWPVTLAFATWREVPAVTGWHDWLAAIAWTHVLKHVRRDGEVAVIVHRGHIDQIKGPTTSLCLGQWKVALPAIYRGLDCQGKDGKQAAVQSALASLRLDMLLCRRPLRDLPGNILYGAWSTLCPVPRGSHLFIQHSTRLDGVWEAKDGKIRELEGDDADVIDWAWNIANARSPQTVIARNKFERIIPRTYTMGSPAEMLSEWFPHWVVPSTEAHLERHAYFALIDAMICASVARKSADELSVEYPLCLILPDDPTADDSTNQGKGLMTRAISTGLVGSGLPMPQMVPDSPSAPDSRAVAATIRQWGTVALDEFQIPTFKTHPLSRDGLQSLCTGGQVVSGLAHENTAGAIELGHSLVINSKCLDLAPDLRNRALPLFLSALSEEQRARTDIKRIIETGEVGIRLKLAAIACVEEYGLVHAVRNYTTKLPATKSSWRFTAHRAMAVVMMQRRTGETAEACCAVLDSLAGDMLEALQQHQLAADASGLSASTETGRNIRVAWPSIWHGLGSDALDFVCADIFASATVVKDDFRGVGVADLIRMRLDHTGSTGRMFSALLSFTSGTALRVSNAAVVRAVSDSMRAFFHTQLHKDTIEYVPMPGDLCAAYEVAVLYRSDKRDLAVAIRKRKTPKA